MNALLKKFINKIIHCLNSNFIHGLSPSAKEPVPYLDTALCRGGCPYNLTRLSLNHLETQAPIVLEGDYLLPETMHWQENPQFPRTERVKGVFLYEPDEKQILQNFSSRESGEGEQMRRARVSWLYGQWLKEECQRLGLPALPARPWDTLEDRIREAIT